MSDGFEKDGFFKIDPEPHLIGDMEHINHFPGVQMWLRAIDNIRMPLMPGMKPETLEGMDPKNSPSRQTPRRSLSTWTSTVWTSPVFGSSLPSDTTRPPQDRGLA